MLDIINNKGSCQIIKDVRTDKIPDAILSSETVFFC